MPYGTPKPQGRSYNQLLAAINELLAVLTRDGDQETALKASFEAAARGFGAQKALLLLVEEREPLRLRAVHVLGKLTPFPVDVAVLLATNRDLDEAVREGTLRADFYDRFRTLAIRLLPLRERPWDIPLLLEHFRRHHENKHRKRTLGFSLEALRALVSYDWPGNVREVARACSLFVIHAQPGAQIDPALIERFYPAVLHAAPNPMAGPPPLGRGHDA